ncbi:MAG TPA: hypothetical protein VMS00_12235 [Acidimicrobiales bacterium]|nr:hypothetical protein [Acidimicrobiales bacterium]
MTKRRLTSSTAAASVTDGAGSPMLPGAIRAGISRRVFLVRGSLVAGAAAVVGSVPGLGNVLLAGEEDSPGVGAAAEAGAAGSAEVSPEVAAGGPIVAHIINASTGEITLYQGTAQIVARDPGVAQAIARLVTAKG